MACPPMTHADSFDKVILLDNVSKLLLCARPSNPHRAVALIVPWMDTALCLCLLHPLYLSSDVCTDAAYHHVETCID